MPSEALLKAIAEKLIPGIPVQTRISILQQTDADSKDAGDEGGSESEENGGSNLSVLAEVIDRATSRSEIQHEVDGMSWRPKCCICMICMDIDETS